MRLPDTSRSLPKTKLLVEYERVETKIPIGLYQELAAMVDTMKRWESRQDFVLEAIREKLDRLRGPSPSLRKSR